MYGVYKMQPYNGELREFIIIFTGTKGECLDYLYYVDGDGITEFIDDCEGE